MNNYFNDAHPLRPYTVSAPFNAGSTKPENALRGKQPTIKKGLWPCEQEGKWVQIEDHRGESGWVDGEPFTVADIGPYPSGWSATPPASTPEEIAAQRQIEILARLSQIDSESVRPLRAIANGDGTDFDRDKLTSLDTEADSLRAELSELEKR
jgi:hypothetical protein